MTGSRRGVRWLCAALAGGIAFPAQVAAQTPPPMVPDVHAIDANHVEFMSGDVDLKVPLLKLGSGPLALEYIWGSGPLASSVRAEVWGNGGPPAAYIGFNASSLNFTTTPYSSYDGGQFIMNADQSQVFTGRDGTVMYIPQPYNPGTIGGAASYVTFPNGKKLRYTAPGGYGVTVVQNNGLMLTKNPAGQWMMVNLAYEYCSATQPCNPTMAWPTSSDSSQATANGGSIETLRETDPVGYKDQINLYAYVGNDAVNLTDPTGLCSSVKDPAARQDCMNKRQEQIEEAKKYVSEQSVESGKKEPAYIAVYDETSGDVSVRTGDSAADRTNTDVTFTSEGGKELLAEPDGRIVERGPHHTFKSTSKIVLVTGHGHPRENPGGGAVSRSLDRANESISNNPGDRALSRVAPAVIKTPSGQIRGFVNEKEVD